MIHKTASRAMKTNHQNKALTFGELIAVIYDVCGKGRASGIEGDHRYFQLFTFRGGKIVRMESIIGKAETLEAVGLSEQDAHADS